MASAPFTYDSEFLKRVAAAGSLKYSEQKMINVFDIPPEHVAEFIEAIRNPQDALYQAYNRARDKADFASDIAIYSEATKGNIEAIKQLQQIRTRNEQESRDLENLKKYMPNA